MTAFDVRSVVPVGGMTGDRQRGGFARPRLVGMRREDEPGSEFSFVHSDVHDDAIDAGEHAKLVAEAMRHLADQQITRADRVRGTARQTFVYVSAFFAVAQAVAFSSFGQEGVSPSDQTTVILFGIAAVIAVAATGVLTICVDQLRRVPDASPQDIVDQADKAIDEDEHVSNNLTKLYAKNVKERSKAIEERTKWSSWVTFSAMVSVGLILAEVLASLIVRIP